MVRKHWTSSTRNDFDLLLSDIRMPRVNGIAVVSHLRSISPWVPFIIMSGYPSHADGKLDGTIMRKLVLLDILEAKIRSLFVH